MQLMIISSFSWETITPSQWAPFKKTMLLVTNETLNGYKISAIISLCPKIIFTSPLNILIKGRESLPSGTAYVKQRNTPVCSPGMVTKGTSEPGVQRTRARAAGIQLLPSLPKTRWAIPAREVLEHTNCQNNPILGKKMQNNTGHI